MLQFDSDGSGSIDFPEFLSLIAKIQKDALNDREEVKEAITVFDQDQKGFLTKSQVENVVKNIGWCDLTFGTEVTLNYISTYIH